MTRLEFSAATKRQALEAAQHRCQDPLCGESAEWAELMDGLPYDAVIGWPSEHGASMAYLVKFRDAILAARFKHAKVLRPIIKRFQLDARAPEGTGLLEVDHERECADGGSNEIENAIVRCVFCHAFKTQARGQARRKGPKIVKGSHRPIEQTNLITRATVLGLQAQVDAVKTTGALGATRALSGAGQTDKPIARGRMMAAQSPALPTERRHTSERGFQEAVQRRERAMLENDGFWGA